MASPSVTLLGVVVPHPKGLGVSRCARLGRVSLVPSAKRVRGQCPLHQPFPGSGFGDSFVLPSILGRAIHFGSLCFVSHLCEEWVKGTIFLLPCLHREGVRALHMLPISEQGVFTRPTAPTYMSHPQCKMSRAQSLGWACIEEECSPASHPISCRAALFQHRYFRHCFCGTLWFLPSHVAVWRSGGTFCRLLDSCTTDPLGSPCCLLPS